jgi:hypothetical protein
MSTDPLPARFRPLRRASPSRRRLLLIVGPLLWLAALIVLAFVVVRRDAVQIALLTLAASFVVALAALGWMRQARVREERDA